MFIMSLSVGGRTIGGTVDIGGFFDEIGEMGSDEDFQTTFTTSATPRVNAGFRVEPIKINGGVKPDLKMEELMEKLEEITDKIHGKHEEALRNSKGSRETLSTDQIPLSTDQTAAEEQTVELHPDDSSSQLSRYNRKFMKNGTIIPNTVLSVTSKRGGRIKEENRVVANLDSIPETIIGYVRTDTMLRKEVEARERAKPINGLAKPYKSNRLNFLAHLYTAFSILTRERQFETVVRMVFSIKRRLNKSPTMELMAQVILVTFDKEEMVIVANPYSLPYIEVGMTLSDDCVEKCFHLLEKEFEILWFQEMKALSIPSFCMKYTKLSEESLMRNEKKFREPERDRARERDRPKYSKARSMSQSLLGI
jgi:hypothetical protein